MESRVLRLPLFVSALLLSTASAWAAYPVGYDQRYIDAVNETKIQPLADKWVSDSLATIGATDHIRSQQIDRHGVLQDTILMTTFNNFPGYSREYDGLNGVYRPRLWSAIAPQMQDFLVNAGTPPDKMSERAHQLLGMPQDYGMYMVCEFYTKPSTLFRPAMDDDITHAKTSQTCVGEMADESNPRRKWFDQRVKETYDPAFGTPFPLTRAGYTYDWANPSVQHFGLTEFMTDLQDFRAGATIENPIWVRSVISIMSYKYYVRATDSFDVTDTCDTLWVGSKFLPVTAGGNQIDIHMGATIRGGEGITVTDISGGAEPSNWVINNAGTIQGAATKNVRDGTPRYSSMQFANTGGILNNIGVITGDSIGVLGSDDATRSIVVNNAGTIRGTTYAIRTGGGDDQINTVGAIDGNIHTGPGNDTINVGGGSIDGSIDGGTGVNNLNFGLSSGSSFALHDDILRMNLITVHSGLVSLFGEAHGDTFVAGAGALGGSCHIFGNLVNHGVVWPEGSSSPITVSAGYAQNPDARLVAMLSDPTAAGANLVVQGEAALADNSVIQLFPATSASRAFRNGDSFRVISTKDGLTDQGTLIDIDSAFLTASGAATEVDYLVTLHRSASFASAADSNNNRSIAAAMDADVATAVGAYGNLLNGLMFTQAAAFNSSVQQLAPTAYLTVGAASNRTTQYAAEGLSGYLRNRRAGQTNLGLAQSSSGWADIAFAKAVGSPTELAAVTKYCANERAIVREYQDPDRERSVWVNPFGIFYGERTSGDHLGFQSNVAGSQFGLDEQMNENCVMGIGAVYCQTHLDTTDLLTAGQIETFRVGPYATWYDDERFFDASFTGGFHSNTFGRAVAYNQTNYIAESSYRAADLSLYVDAGRDIAFGSETFSPIVSMQYTYYRQNGFLESGADAASLLVDPRNLNSLRSRVGGQFSRVRQWGNVKIVREVFGGWAHEYLANDPLEAQFAGGVTPFAIDWGGLFRDAGYYGLSLTALPNRHTSVFSRYGGEYSSGGHFMSVDLGFTYAF